VSEEAETALAVDGVGLLTDGVTECKVDGLGPALVDVGLGRRRHAPGVQVAHLVHGAGAAARQEQEEQQHRRRRRCQCPAHASSSSARARASWGKQLLC
jgi:hypothetical protein